MTVTPPARFRLHPLAAAVLLFSALPMSAHAQSADSTVKNNSAGNARSKQDAATTKLTAVQVEAQRPNEGYNPAVSTVGGKIPTPIRDIPQSVVVVDQQLMQAQGATSLQEALRYVPGITFQAAEGGTIGNNINLRGFSAQTDIFLDGFRDRGQYYRDVFSLESVEVLQGPSSMLFGRGSTGGVINQVSKLPSMTPHDELSTTIGTSDQYRITGDFDHPLSDSASFRLPVMAQTVHSTRDVMHNQDYGAAPSLQLELSPKTELTLTSLIEHNHDMPDYGLPPLNGHPAPVSRDNFYGLTDNATVQDVQMLGARIRYELSPTLTLRNQAQYSHYSIDANETAANSVGTCSTDPCTAADFTVLPTKSSGNYTNLPLNQLYVQLGSHDRNITDSSAYDQADAEWRFETGPIRHKLIVGTEIGRDTYTNQGYTLNNLPVVSLTNPIYESETQAGVTTTAGNLSQATATTYAAYFNDTLSLGKHWKVVGGLRWDRFQAELNNTVPSSRSLASAEQTVYFNSVRSGILYQPTNEQTYYVSYGTSFDPSLEQLTGTVGTQALPPEKNRSYEVGAKWDLFDDNLSLTSSLFQVKQTNSRSQVDTGVYELNGTVRVNGAEVTFAGRITPKWQVFGGYTYLDGKIVDPSPITGDNGNQPANTPRNNATLWTSYAITQSWSAGTGLIWQSSRFVNTTNVVSVPSFVRWDATVAYVRPHYDVRLNLLNLSNVRYFDNLIQSDGGRAVPGIDRSAQVTLTYRF